MAPPVALPTAQGLAVTMPRLFVARVRAVPSQSHQTTRCNLPRTSCGTLPMLPNPALYQAIRRPQCAD